MALHQKTEDQPGFARRAVATVAATAVAALVASVVVGFVDAAWAVQKASTDAGFGELLATGWYAAGFCGLLALPLCAGLGVAMLASPFDVGPFGAIAFLKNLATSSGDTRARQGAAAWGSVVTLGLGLVLMFKLNHFFMTAFHHPTLAALTLAVATLVLLAVLGVGWLLLRRVAFGALRTLGAAGSALVPLGLVALAPVAILIAVPVMYAETWDALDLRLPVLLVVMSAVAWATLGVARRKLPWAVGAVASVVMIVALVSPVAAFGNDPEDAGMVFALGEHSALSRLPLGALRGRFDADGDGYASRLGGGDCDDANASINPAAEEVLSNGVDEDCDGEDLAPAAAPTPDTEPQADAGAPVQEPKVERRKLNILMIMGDTVRYDVMGYAGYERPTTPNLDKLAARSAVFERGYSVSSKTPTALAPIMASRYPSEMPRSFHHFVYFPPENLFLAEILRDEGYLTAASGCHWYFDRKYGYDQGFDRWKAYAVPGDQMEKIPTSKEATDTAIEFLTALEAGALPDDGVDPRKDVGPDKPWFLFVHYLDPHKHYIHHEGFEPFGRSGRDRYDGEVRFMDHHIGRLLDAAEKADPGLRNTVVVFYSDHGESFGEHEEKFHGRDLYDIQLRVPWILHLPGTDAQKVKTRTSLIDLAPTLLDAIGVKRPESFRGRSIFPALAAGEEPKPAVIYAEMPPGPYNGEFRAYIDGDEKLIHRLYGNYFRYFDLEADEDELKDLYRSKKEEAASLKKRYQLWRAQHLAPVEATYKPPRR